MDLPDTNISLDVQWLITLGPITTNYKTMEMSFVEEGGRKVVLRVQDTRYIKYAEQKQNARNDRITVKYLA